MPQNPNAPTATQDPWAVVASAPASTPALAPAPTPAASPTTTSPAAPAADPWAVASHTPVSSDQSAATPTKIDWLGMGTEPLWEQIKQSVLDNPISEKLTHALATPSEWAKQRRDANLKAAAAGKPLPHSESVNALLDEAGTAGRMLGGLSQPKNLALVATGQVAPVTTGAYIGSQGAQMLLAAKHPGETPAQEEERRLMGASMLFGGAGGGAKAAEVGMPDAGITAAEKTGGVIAHPIDTAVDVLKGPANLLDAATLRRVFGYSPREIEGTEVTGQRSLANLAQGPINRSMGAAPRDVRYGDPAAGLINNNIAAPTNFGRLQAVNQVLDDISPKVDAALAANPKTIPVDDIINDSIKDASDAIHKSKMTPMEKRTANRQLEALREEEEKGDYSLVEANDIKQRVGDAVNWEKRPAPMATPVEDAYRSVYGQIRKAIDKAAPDVAGMNLNRTNLIAAQHALQDSLLRQKIGQGPLAQSMGIFNPREWGAVAGHVLSPVLAPFGHAPEVEPEVGAAAGLPSELVPTTTALQNALGALRKEPNQTSDQEALANQLEQELQKQGEAARAKARTQEAVQPFKKARSAAPTNPTNGAAPTAPAPVTGNHSGESAASTEAINRVAAEKSGGVKIFRIDTRNPKVEIPVYGVDAVDARPSPYEKIVRRDPNGHEFVLSQGLKVH